MTQKILIVEDDVALCEALIDTIEMVGYETVAADSGEAALERIARDTPRLVLSDVHMRGMDGHTLLRRIKTRWPDMPVVLMTAYGTIEKAVEAMREGAVDYLSKPFEAQTLVETIEKYVGPPRVQAEGEPIAADPRSRDLLALAQRVAESEATVLITGESGSGKEVLARFIHRHSRRGDGPFVAINCAAIPENMLEATLFGYEKGAFTGAYKTTAGKFEQASGGTLLLDEISEMDLGLQAKLLRVLQEREVERLGGGRVIRLDVRVLATSNRDMLAQVRAGRFREDLYYRLNVFPLHLPPLRERPLDIVPLAQSFLERVALAAGRAIPILSEAAGRRLTAHTWPGNVRELDNMMQRAIILARGDLIEEVDLHFEPISGVTHAPPALIMAPPPPAPVAVNVVPPVTMVVDERPAASLNDDLRSQEYRIILDALRNGNRKDAAERLGISQRTLRYKLARMREEGIAVPA